MLIRIELFVEDFGHRAGEKGSLACGDYWVLVKGFNLSYHDKEPYYYYRSLSW